MITSKIKVMGLLGLPLLAIAIAVMVFAFNPSTTNTTSAADGTCTFDQGDVPCIMEVSVGGETVKAEGPIGGTFKVSVGLPIVLEGGGLVGPEKDPCRPNDQFDPVTGDPVINECPPGGAFLVQSFIAWENKDGGDPRQLNRKNGNGVVTWPDCFDGGLGGGSQQFSFQGCLTGNIIENGFGSTFKGEYFSWTLGCPDGDPSSHLIELLVAASAQTVPQGTNGAKMNDFPGGAAVLPQVNSMQLNCVPPPTATPTATPPPIPKMSKCDQTDNDENGEKDNGPCNNLVNHFLVRQGDKIPPLNCLAGTPSSLAEKLSQGIVSRDPKADPENTGDKFQVLAAFEFEVHYDATKVCIDLTVGEAFDAAAAVTTCLVEDDDSKPQLEGVARMGCFTQGKDGLVDGLLPLASVDVYPQPEVYSQAKPNQDNGVVVQINNVGCDLGDEQGHAIPIFSCDDADITFRYLEGDVEPDCVIDVVDAQAIAFRWGVEKGSLIYKDFMNLEPSSQQSDNDIDINDLQFVFGRFGSTCKDPHPAQDAVNPKA